jgi:hypothetical protein
MIFEMSAFWSALKGRQIEEIWDISEHAKQPTLNEQSKLFSNLIENFSLK